MTSELLRRDAVLVTDGGLATQLEATGHDLSDDLWSARLLVDDPRAIVEAHLAFLRSGAQVVTTASYQASFEGFAAVGIEAQQAARLMRRSVDLAREAVAIHESETGEQALVAASVGPYGAVLADGSEYHGRYGLTVAELVAWHEPRLEVLVESGADLLAVETLPDADEAEAILDLTRGIGMNLWLSFTVEGGLTRAGQRIEDAFAVAAGIDGVAAVGVNCCAPREVAPALRIAGSVTGLPGVAYPNSGEGWDHDTGWRGRATDPVDLVDEWIDAGARIVGGCCRVTPEQIGRMARLLRTS